MSAANYVKSKWLDFLINGAISFVLILVAFYLSSNDLDARTWQDKLDGKADCSYVDKEINRVEVEIDKAMMNAEKVNTIKYDNIQQMFNLIRIDLKDIKQEQSDARKRK